jgi:glutaredoxin
MNLTIYSKSGCPYCDKIKQVAEFLEIQKSFKVTVYNLNEDFNKDQFYQEFGEGSTFPQVTLDDKHLGGCTDTVRYLKENKLL